MSGAFGPVLDAAGAPLDQVRLVGLQARGHHGVQAQEKRFGQDFEVDITVHLDTRAAARSDDLADTVDYGELAAAVARVVRGPSVDLLETLAARIAEVCLADRRVVAADVAVHKPHAPIPERFGDVVVVVRRCRGPSSGPDPRRGEPGEEHQSTTEGVGQ